MPASNDPLKEIERMKKAIVLVSGGLDSATCLAIAQAEGYACYALSFDYGQRSASDSMQLHGCLRPQVLSPIKSCP